MLKIKNLSVSRGAKHLIEHINFTLYPGQIIGVVGKNGCGKSSFFAILQGEEHSSAGDVEIKSGTRVVILEQEVPALDCSAVQYVLSGDEVLAGIYQQLTHGEKVQDYALMMDCHAQLSDVDGYSAHARASKILAGLGFANEAMDQAVHSFSGGWRMRLNLAKCLFSDSDCLLLNEVRLL